MRGWGGGVGWGEKKFVLALDAACYACSLTLRLSFSYLRSAVTASFDIKKFHRNATATFIFIIFFGAVSPIFTVHMIV